MIRTYSSARFKTENNGRSGNGKNESNIGFLAIYNNSYQILNDLLRNKIHKINPFQMRHI